jgi:hypothetical protein
MIMSKSITTKYHGHTSSGPSRISAKTSGGGKRVFFTYMQEFSSDDNHKSAASKLAKELGWHGDWQGASLDEKGSMIWVNTSDKFSKNYQFIF